MNTAQRIARTLQELAQEEGKATALETAQKWQVMLEDLAEVCGADSCAVHLLQEVNAALTELVAL